MSDLCACGRMPALTRTGFGSQPGDYTSHNWTACVTYRVRENPVRNDIEDLLMMTQRPKGNG